MLKNLDYLQILNLSRQMKKWQDKIQQENLFAFTMDLDWASEACIEYTLKFFIENNFPLTIYCTHESNIIKKYWKNNLIHLGIHPNFLNDSSQGKTYKEIVDYLFKLYPDAITMRCHRWFSDNDIYELLLPRGILFDSNEITLMDIVPPHLHRSGIISFPVFWEDGAYLWHNMNLDYNKSVKPIFNRIGLKVINFHPFHFALNTPFFSWTRKLKDSLTREEYNKFDPLENPKKVWQERGIRTFIIDLMENIKQNNTKCILLSDLYSKSPLAKIINKE